MLSTDLLRFQTMSRGTGSQRVTRLSQRLHQIEEEDLNLRLSQSQSTRSEMSGYGEEDDDDDDLNLFLAQSQASEPTSSMIKRIQH